MGNSNSNTNVEILCNSEYKKIIDHYNLQGKISKNDLCAILKTFDVSFVDHLGNYYFKNDEEIEEITFNELVENFQFKSSGKLINFLMKICDIGPKIKKEELKLILKWISFSSSEEFCEIIFQSYVQSLTDCDELDSDHFLSWMERNFSDLGLDFARSVYRVLNCEGSGEMMTDKCLEVVKQLDSSVIKLSELFMLFGCLPVIYQSSAKLEEFSVQHAKHWVKLYNSNSHGLSSRKFREKCFDYKGPILIFFKSPSGLYCLASDVGVKEDWNSYGGIDARLFQLRPFYKKYLSGFRSQNNDAGIIYSHFSAKSGRRGLFVGHNPLRSPALELNEDCNAITVMGRAEQLVEMEAWAVGFDVESLTAKLTDIRQWERKEVDKEQNRKLKTEKWDQNPDRDILDWGGVNVRHTDFIGGTPDQGEPRND